MARVLAARLARCGQLRGAPLLIGSTAALALFRSKIGVIQVIFPRDAA